MLYEIKKVKQEPGKLRKKWFTDDFFDLFIWLDENNKLKAFQLTYDKGFNERAVMWRRKGTIHHYGVDDGENSPLTSMSPMLKNNGSFNNRAVAEKFRQSAQEINQTLAGFIYKKLITYTDTENQ